MLISNSPKWLKLLPIELTGPFKQALYFCRDFDVDSSISKNVINDMRPSAETDYSN